MREAAELSTPTSEYYAAPLEVRETIGQLVDWLICLSVGHNFFKKQRSYTSMLLMEHLLTYVFPVSFYHNSLSLVSYVNVEK